MLSDRCQQKAGSLALCETTPEVTALSPPGLYFGEVSFSAIYKLHEGQKYREQLLEFCKAARLVRQLGLPCAGRSPAAQYREVGTCKGLAVQH